VPATAPLLDLLADLRAQLAGGATELVIQVLDPDRGRGRYPGEPVEVDGVAYVHRPLRLWVELAERIGLRLLTPRPAAPPLIELRFEVTPFVPSGARPKGARSRGTRTDVTEKYGVDSDFARISKLEEPAFVIDFAEALARVPLPPAPRVLDLGVNRGDELALMRAVDPRLAGARFTGVDHSASALARARARFPDAALIEADLGAIAALDLGEHDLVVCIGTLQSPGIDDRELLRHVVQRRLAPGGSLILGFPNCRYLDGEVQHGTRMVNFREPELGLLVKDIAFYRKYLQQHRRQVHVTGSRYLLVTAIPIQPTTDETRR
jgi:SAM-dependent methyltransferase